MGKVIEFYEPAGQGCGLCAACGAEYNFSTAEDTSKFCSETCEKEALAKESE